ncbi:MAG TPA: DUF4838 domain-containing protein [Phycisphaeraceae bacterium]
MRIPMAFLSLALVGIVAAACSQVASADVVLVRDATPQAVIVLPGEPTEEESLAAERFQHYVKRISGAVLEIVNEDDKRPRDGAVSEVHIGRTRAAGDVLAELRNRNAPPESSLVVTKGNSVFVTGVDPIGTLHATYFLLEDFGCRWYIPADWGTVVPESADLIVRTQSTYRSPSFALRSGLTHATTNIDEDPTWAEYEWGRGNHLGGWRWWGAGHSYRFLIPREQFEKHPEWFALVDGRRTPDQLCISNPEGRAFALETVRKALAEYGDNPPELVCISPNDTRASRFCQCEDCQKFVQTRPDGTKDFSEGHDRMIAYANFFANALRDEYPNTRVMYYVDYHSHGFPSIVKPAPNSVLQVVHWVGDQFHGVDDNSPMGGSIARWSRFGLPIIAHTYWGIHTSWSFWPVVHTIRQEIPYYHSKGVVGLYSETHKNWGSQHLNFIVYPRLLWDVNTDVDAWISEFCEKFYGPAAEPMRQYYALLEQAAADGPPQYKYRQTLIPTFTPNVLAAMRAKIAEAERIINAQSDEVLKIRFAFAKAGFEIGDLYFSAEHLMRTYPKTKDPTIRQRVVEMLRRAVEIIEDPRFRDKSGVQFTHLAESTPSDLVGDLRKILAQHEQGTTFAPGEFKYFEDYYLGGRTFLDVQSRSGFINDRYGLSLDGKTTGTLIYRFDVHEGAFETVTGSLVLTSPTSVTPLRLGVRASSAEPWRSVAYTGDGTSVDFDLTPAAKGQQEVWLRIELKNQSSESAHVLHQLHLNGRVDAGEE